jgi:hypothetical protein
VSQGKYRALVTDINLGRGKIDGRDSPDAQEKSTPTFPSFIGAARTLMIGHSKGVPNSIMLEKPFAPAQLVTVAAVS